MLCAHKYTCRILKIIVRALRNWQRHIYDYYNKDGFEHKDFAVWWDIYCLHKGISIITLHSIAVFSLDLNLEPFYWMTYYDITVSMIFISFSLTRYLMQRFSDEKHYGVYWGRLTFLQWKYTFLVLLYFFHFDTSFLIY